MANNNFLYYKFRLHLQQNLRIQSFLTNDFILTLAIADLSYYFNDLSYGALRKIGRVPVILINYNNYLIKSFPVGGDSRNVALTGSDATCEV